MQANHDINKMFGCSYNNVQRQKNFNDIRIHIHNLLKKYYEYKPKTTCTESNGQFLIVWQNNYKETQETKSINYKLIGNKYKSIDNNNDINIVNIRIYIYIKRIPNQTAVSYV